MHKIMIFMTFMKHLIDSRIVFIFFYWPSYQLSKILYYLFFFLNYCINSSGWTLRSFVKCSCACVSHTTKPFIETANCTHILQSCFAYHLSSVEDVKCMSITHTWIRYVTYGIINICYTCPYFNIGFEHALNMI